jgi:cyanophycin synthetase
MDKDNKCDSIKAASSRLLADELAGRKIRIEHLNPFNSGDAYLRLTHKKHVEFVFGAKSSLTTATADRACRSKILTKTFLSGKGLSFTEGELFKCSDMESIREFTDRIGFPCVLKKNDGSGGKKIFIGVENFSECEEIVDKHFQDEKYILVEKQYYGQEYRIFATRKKVLGIILREPANVTGDGRSTVRELIEKKNRNKLEKFSIRLDAITQRCLKNQGIDFDQVIGDGVRVQLRDNSNSSTGGDTVDFTEQAHPEFKQIAVQAINSIPGLAYGGVDIMTPRDISLPPTKKSYVIVEVNSNPGIYIHHFPHRGKPRNVASGIVDVLFPETKK